MVAPPKKKSKKPRSVEVEGSKGEEGTRLTQLDTSIASASSAHVRQPQKKKGMLLGGVLGYGTTYSKRLQGIKKTSNSYFMRCSKPATTGAWGRWRILHYCCLQGVHSLYQLKKNNEEQSHGRSTCVHLSNLSVDFTVS